MVGANPSTRLGRHLPLGAAGGEPRRYPAAPHVLATQAALQEVSTTAISLSSPCCVSCCRFRSRTLAHTNRPTSDHDDPANLYCAPHPKIDTVALAEYHHIRWHHRLPLNFSSSDTHAHPPPSSRPPLPTDRTDGEKGNRKVRKKRRRYANVEWVLELDSRQ